MQLYTQQWTAANDYHNDQRGHIRVNFQCLSIEFYGFWHKSATRAKIHGKSRQTLKFTASAKIHGFREFREFREFVIFV